MRRLIVTLPLILIALITALPAFGYLDDQSPFKKSEHIRRLKYRQLTADKNGDYPNGKGVVIDFNQKDPMQDDNDEDYDSSLQFSVIKDGKRILDRQEMGYILFEDAPYCADINGDGQDDFMLTGCHTGNSLETASTFILSRKDGSFDTFVMYDWETGPKNFFISREGRLLYVKTEKLQDGGHTYWRYNLLRLKDNKFVNADDADKRFPRWQLFTNGENHDDAGLTDRQKRMYLSDNDQSLGYRNEYLPFKKGSKIKPFPLVNCMMKTSFVPPENRENLTESDVVAYGVYDDGAGLVINLTKNSYGYCYLSVNKGGIVLYDKTAIGNEYSRQPEEVQTILRGDMNGDGKEDFFIRPTTFYGYCKIVLLLSKGDTYTLRIFDNYFGGPENFVDIKGDGRCQYIHTEFVEIDSRNKYLVYDILSIDGDMLKIDNGVLPGFPKWEVFQLPLRKKPVKLTNCVKEYMRCGDGCFGLSELAKPPK